jgi:SAM-dependent methyltransferase
VEPDDVPTAVNFLEPAHARTWTAETTLKKPWRAQFFAAFCAALPDERLRILEVGSGPGHLAREILTHRDVAEYVALDFSDAMHELAREHLGELAAHVTFVTRNFRSPDWVAGLTGFDAVVTQQAVHEARHKRHAQPLLVQARTTLAPSGLLLFCDSYASPSSKPHLFLERDEQPAVLHAAGFATIELLRDEHGMALYAAR